MKEGSQDNVQTSPPSMFSYSLVPSPAHTVTNIFHRCTCRGSLRTRLVFSPILSFSSLCAALRLLSSSALSLLISSNSAALYSPSDTISCCRDRFRASSTCVDHQECSHPKGAHQAGKKQATTVVLQTAKTATVARSLSEGKSTYPQAIIET